MAGNLASASQRALELLSRYLSTVPENPATDRLAHSRVYEMCVAVHFNLRMWPEVPAAEVAARLNQPAKKRGGAADTGIDCVSADFSVAAQAKWYMPTTRIQLNDATRFYTFAASLRAARKLIVAPHEACWAKVAGIVTDVEYVRLGEDQVEAICARARACWGRPQLLPGTPGAPGTPAPDPLAWIGELLDGESKQLKPPLPTGPEALTAQATHITELEARLKTQARYVTELEAQLEAQAKYISALELRAVRGQSPLTLSGPRPSSGGASCVSPASAPPRSGTEERKSPHAFAAEAGRGNLPAVAQMLADGAPHDRRAIAAAVHNLPMVQLLVDGGCTVDARTVDQAIAGRHHDTVRFLLSARGQLAGPHLMPAALEAGPDMLHAVLDTSGGSVSGTVLNAAAGDPRIDAALLGKILARGPKATAVTLRICVVQCAQVELKDPTALAPCFAKLGLLAENRKTEFLPECVGEAVVRGATRTARELLRLGWPFDHSILSKRVNELEAGSADKLRAQASLTQLYCTGTGPDLLA